MARRVVCRRLSELAHAASMHGLRGEHRASRCHARSVAAYGAWHRLGAHWLLAGERFKVQHGRCDRHRVPWSKYFGVAAGIVSIASMLTFVGSMLAANGRFGTAQGLLLGVFVVSMVATIGLAMTNLRIE